MKNKLSLFLLIIVILSCSFGCFSCNDIFTYEVESYTNELTLTYDQDINGHIPYNKEDIPSFTLKFDGTVNITKNRLGEYECIFAKNDDFFISKIIKDLISEYTTKNRISYYQISTDNESETWMNRRDESHDDKIYFKVKDGKIYNEICYITLENGLQLTINYARFTDSDNITYYRWQNTESIRMVLHYPLMVCDRGEYREFLFIALPNQVTYRFDTTTKRIDDLLEKEKFTGSEYYTYSYTTDYNTDYNNYLEYYKNNLNGRFENDEFIYTFLGHNFSITFNNDNFVIKNID